MVEGDDCCMLNECFHTRSSSRNLFQDNPVFTQNQSGNVSADKTPTPTRDTEVSPHLFSPLQSANPSSAINAAEIEKMVELSLTKILQNINLPPRSDNANTSGNTNHQNVSTQQQPHIQLNDQGNCNLSGNNLNPNNNISAHVLSASNPSHLYPNTIENNRQIAYTSKLTKNKSKLKRIHSY